MVATGFRTKTASKTTTANADLKEGIRSYVRTYVLWHGRTKAAETFGVSRHTLWRCLERGQLGLSLPRVGHKSRGEHPGGHRGSYLGNHRQPCHRPTGHRPQAPTLVP